MAIIMKKQIDIWGGQVYKLLRWSEKYTKTDMVYLAHGGFWLTLGQVVSAASSLLLSLAFANLLPKETFGIYKYVLSAAGILAIPTLHGMGTAVTQAVARGHEGSFVPALKARIRWGLIGGVTGLALAGYYYLQGNATLAISFLITAVFLPIMDPFSTYDALLQGKKMFGVSSRYGMISQVAATFSMVITLLATKNIFIILLAYFIPWTVLRFIFLKITLKKFPPNQSQDEKTIPYGKNLSIINILTTVAAYMDRFLVFHFLGAVELAVYSIAIAFPENIRNFFKFIQPLALPKFANQEKTETKKYLFHKMWRMAAVIVVIIVLYIIAAPLVFKLLMPKYMDAVLYSQLFSVSLIYFVIALPVSALQAQLEQKKLYRFYTTTSLFQLATLLPMAYFFGIMGVILSRIVSRFFQIVFMIYVIKKL